MKQDETIKARHTLNGETKEFTLVATQLKRQSEGEPAKYYPWFKEEEATYTQLVDIFGDDMLQQLAIDSLCREFQLLYFQRSPSKEMVPIVKPDGTIATVAEKDDKGNLTGKQIPVLTKDMKPRKEQFLEYVSDENLSGREITPEYCMRKATLIISGTDKKWKDKSKMERDVEAFKWMGKAQTMMAAMLEASK